MAVPQNSQLRGSEDAGLPPRGNERKKIHRERDVVGTHQPRPGKPDIKAVKDKKAKMASKNGRKPKKPRGSDSESVETNSSASEGSKSPPPVAQNGQAETTVNSKSQKPKKEKKDRLRQEPAWLFPPDEENPVLNPKPKSEEVEKQEVRDRLHSIEYLKHHAVAAPHKPAPPKLLLQLVGSFLDSYGFKSTGRVYTAERAARVKMIGWDDSVGAEELDPKLPSLVQIYKQWLATSGTAAAITPIKSDSKSISGHKKPDIPKSAGHTTVDSDTTSSEGEESNDSDDSSDDASGAGPVPSKAIPKINSLEAKPELNVAVKSDSTSDSSSGSENESVTSEKAALVVKLKPLVTTPVNELKRATATMTLPRNVSAPDSDSDTSLSGSDASSSDSGVHVTKAKTEQVGTSAKKDPPTTISTANKPTTKPGYEDSDTSSTTSLDSETSSSQKATTSSQSRLNGQSSSAGTIPAPDVNGKAKHHEAIQEAVGSDSHKRKRSTSPRDSDTQLATKVPKKTSTPFQRIPSDTKIDPKLASNAYQPYDYADRAYKDLSVTKGKGFTKEKNKKKRGSYRGGNIDIAGGKGIKFED